MNKNTKYAIGVIVALVILGGAGYYFKQKGNSTDTGSNSTGSTSSSLFSSIKDAMSKGVALKCVYTDESGKTTTAYVKGKGVRATISGSTDKTSPNNFMIWNDQMLMWNDQTAQGFMLGFDPNKTGTGNNSYDKAVNTDVIGSLEAYKDKCQPATVADSTFDKPAGVKFEDFSKLYPATK